MATAPKPLCAEIGHDDAEETPEAVALAPMYSGPDSIPWDHAAFCASCLRDWRANNERHGLPTTVLMLVPSDDY
jgi:hypothetical protein